ncbi:MAG: pyridoxamine 5'-phosphate oxidase family protein [Synergistaceae bacterium]|jgi:nitroimidazol reductase NimA-like FMN-containing flavoprotein (pyridoxamine 5'-phosphate oxidase superfamily)|nr:pyridoxamine 5'-phosphate oxidase family protein [Synergistaceae bacterium]
MRKQYEMRRKNKQVTDPKWMEEVLRRGRVLHLGLAGEDGWPYVVPMGYGYESGSIYVHGAPEGHKNDILAINPRVCFQVTLDAELVTSESSANFTMKYRSVTGFGHLLTLTDLSEKNAALRILMDHYGGPHSDLEEGRGKIWVARLDIESMTGKNSVYPL